MKEETADTKTGPVLRNDQANKEKERDLFFSQPGWLLSGCLTAEFLSQLISQLALVGMRKHF